MQEPEKNKVLHGPALMTIRLKWFSVLAERRGKRNEAITVKRGATGNDLLERLSEDMPMLAIYRQHIRLAINRAYADPATVLHDDDEVAFITPVSGG